jgi:hypothetical protein
MYSLFIVLLELGVPHATPVDSCVELVPDALRQVLMRRFPDARLPLTTDSREESRRYAVSKGNACLLIAKADFDGDGRPDLVLLLPAKRAKDFRLVVALNEKSGFTVTDLGSWAEPVTDLFVDAAPSGTYTHTEAYPFQPEPGAAERVTSAHEGFYFGQIEAGADVYFVDHGQWRHVHAID